MRVTVYYAWIPDNLAPEWEDHWLALLPLHKRDAIRRMRFDKGRAASLVALQLLKRGMESLGLENFDLAGVCFPPGGKPYCEPGIDFNISHSKDMAVCAISTDARIGVDAEKLREIRIESFRRFLHAPERAWVGEDRRRFFELWTQKEAVVKAHGKGGIVNLRRVNIAHGKGVLDGQSWRLQEVKIHPDYVAHVAIDRDLPGTVIPATRLDIVE